MNQNLEQLKKLAQIFNTDKLISPEEIQQIFKGIVEILATYKKDTSSINEDTKSVVNKLLEDVISIHKESVDAVEEKKKELGNDFADKLTELRQMVTSIQEEMDKEDEVPEDDTDDEEEKQALIAEIMAQITPPEVKATTVSGEEIVDKINELPLDEDNKIDWARIKNAPKIGKQTISGSPTVLANAVDLDGSTRANNYAIVWDATRGRYTHTAMSGGGSPGGSTTQLQYNNAGAFGGISGATTDGTAVTYTANNLKAADITASGSGGFLIQSNSGTDVGLFGAGGGAGATFYGGVNVGGNITLNGSTRYIYGDTTSQSLRLDSAAGVELNYSTNAVKIGSARVQIWTGGTEKVSFSGSTVGLLTTAPTHTLTLGSTGTGIALYNTADQTTNYERVVFSFASNIATIATAKGGTGVHRAITINAGAGNTVSLQTTNTNYSVQETAGTSGFYQFLRGTGTANAAGTVASGTWTASSGISPVFQISPTINQSSTAGYTALLVNPTETTTGSGSKLLADFQVGGVSKFSVTNAAVTTISNTSGQTMTFSPVLGGANFPGIELLTTAGNGSFFRANTTSGVQLDMLSNAAVSGIIRTNNSYPLELRTNNTVGLTISTAQVGTFANNSIITANAITATANAATIPVTKGRNIVTNNSAATLTITLTTSGAVNMQTVIVQILDFSAAAQTITFVNTENSTVSVPATTNGSTTLPLTVGFIYNAATSKWRCIASA